MAAAQHGHLEVMNELLYRGAPWNAVDRQYKCAGDYALEAGHQKCVDRIVNAGVTSELLLACLKKKSSMSTRPETLKAEPNKYSNDYLKRDVKYTEDGKQLLDSDKDGVMMSWESPLMEASADVITSLGADVLNVGFGMGIIDNYIQDRKPRSHTIIEAHPQVYAYMLKEGWDKKPGVTILHGRWQDMMEKIDNRSFDGIYFDTYGENYGEQSEFHHKLPRILRPGGCYSFFNGLCPDNIIFHGGSQQELDALGFTTTYIPCPIAEVQDKKVWKGVKRKYFYNDTYQLPICIFDHPIAVESKKKLNYIIGDCSQVATANDDKQNAMFSKELLEK
eukprot:GSMAST32.ASY1.ANO1.926.1 assembled CDS